MENEVRSIENERINVHLSMHFTYVYKCITNKHINPCNMYFILFLDGTKE